MESQRLIVFVALALVALQSVGVTIHRSFRTREAGFDFGTGRATVAYPVDAKIGQAIDAARQKESEKEKIVIGKVTRVSDGDTIHVVTGGNVKYKVRLNRIDAPESDQPYGKESAEYLAKLIKGKTVRVEWKERDRYGRVLGIVFLDQTDVNLQMVATGNAHHYSFFDHTPAYAEAEATAKAKKLGLWSSATVILPSEWRKNKRRM